jgi:hypothetical protein
MQIIAECATIFIKGISGEPGVEPQIGPGPYRPEDTVRVEALPHQVQVVPDWVRETNSWRNGIKDGRLKEVGAGGIGTSASQPMPSAPNPPLGAVGEEGPPLVVDPAA